MLLVSGATKTVATIHDEHLGVLLRPGNGNRATDKQWAIDNGAFSGFEEDQFIRLLDQCADRSSECMWVAAPDVVGDSAETLSRFLTWEPILRERKFRVALVSQDGMRTDDVPWGKLDCLFIGGTDAHKLGPEAVTLVREAKRLGKLVHVGRVNSLKRIRRCMRMGVDSIDGTSFSMFSNMYIGKALKFMAKLENTMAREQSLFCTP